MVRQELKILEEFKNRNLLYDDEILFSKDIVLIHRGLLWAFRKYFLFSKLVHYIKKGILSFDLEGFAGKSSQNFIHVLYALRELEVLEVDVQDGKVEMQVLQKEFFGKKTWRRKTKALFAGITAHRTMKRLGIPFEVVFNISRDGKRLYDVGVLTCSKCLFFISGYPEKKIKLSVPYEVYSLVSPPNIKYLRQHPTALNVLRVKKLVEKFFGQD